MVYLAEQSSNGTYQDEVDREAITNEFEQLKSEINRIADSSNFNGIKLLDGSLGADVKVAGETDMTVTVLADGQLAKSPQAGAYSIDFTDAKITNVQTTATSSATFTIFGKTLAIGDPTKGGVKLGAGESLEGADLAQAIADAWNAQTASKATELHGVVAKATVEGNKVVFTMEKIGRAHV